MLTLFGLSISQPLDDNGSIVPGGKLTFYNAGLETLKTVYADADGDAELTNPVVLDGNGRKAIYLADDGAYDVDFESSDGETLYWTLYGVIAAAPVV